MSAGFQIIIAASDKTAGVIDRINKRIETMRAPAKRVQKSLAKFGELSGVNAVGKSIGDIGKKAMGAAEGLARVVEPLAAITGAASIAGMFRLTQQWAVFGSQLGFTAQRLNMSAGNLQSLQGAAELAGASAGDLTSGLSNLSQVLFDSLGGRNNEAAGMFQQLGIAIDDGTHHAISSDKAMKLLADRIAGFKNPLVQARIATEAFGGAGEALLPFLRLGARGIEEYQEKARRFGVFNPAGIRAANDMRMAYSSVGLAVKGLTNSIAEQLGPVVTPLLNHMADWISLNREWIASNIQRYVEEFSDYLKSIDWDKVETDIEGVWKKVDGVAQAFGGWKRVVEGIIAINLAGWATRAIAPFTTVLRLLALIPGSGVTFAMLDLAGIGLAAEAITRKSTLRFDKGRGLSDDSAAADYISGQSGVVLLDRAKNGPATGGLGGSIYRGLFGQSGLDRQQEALSYFQQQGWSRAQSAGIVANLTAESKLDPGAVGDGGDARGIAQWHLDRQANFNQLFGHPVKKGSYEEQLAFTQWELTHTEANAGGELRKAQTPEDAGAAVSRLYERPHDANGSAQRRGGMAADIYALPSASPAAMADGPSGGGKHELNINVSMAPGLSVKTTTSTSGNASPPKIDTSMNAALVRA